MTAALTVTAAAGRLGISRSAVLRALTAGHFPGAMKPGRAWRIPAESVDAYLHIRAARRSTAARIAVDISWSRTPNRAERTAPATRANPGSLEYWERKIRAEGVVSEADIPAAAVNARRAYMARLALASAKARAAKKAKTTRRATRRTA